MKTVFLLFDSLNRRMLAPYNKEVNYTPNFDRLAKKSITFNNHYIGSMPCMPARRDMQSGRLSFLHRSWGPLEPYDNSFPEILRRNKTYTHLITDHYHYFEDGGSTYHNRYNSFDFIRGQERDPWKAMVEPPIERFKKMYHQSQSDFTNRESRYYFYPINSEFIKEEKDFPSVQCFASGLDFLKTNKDAKDWFRPGSSGKYYLDLLAINKMDAERAGLMQGNMFSLDHCTCCSSPQMFSYRREGKTGRILTTIMLRP